MTEQEWLKCADPLEMLRFVKGKASERDLRLFACACCRRIWYFPTDGPSWTTVEVAERFADGRASAGELAQAHGCAYFSRASDAALPAAWDAARAASTVDLPPNQERSDGAGVPPEIACAAEHAARAGLLRDIIGNPFRPVAIDPSWVTLEVGTLARTIYDGQDFDRLPALADALVKAGCDHADLLGHCRQPGPHVKGCWAVDLLLGSGKMVVCPPAPPRQDRVYGRKEIFAPVGVGPA